VAPDGEGEKVNALGGEGPVLAGKVGLDGLLAPVAQDAVVGAVAAAALAEFGILDDGGSEDAV
jgi:hypothetical protein